MIPQFGESTSDVSTPFVSVTDNVTIYDNSQTVAQNTSLREDCIKVIFSEMEYLPWDNPENIISAEVEKLLRRIQINVLGLLFLIGGPANVINMVVFYKQGLKDRVNLCLFALSLADGLYLTMNIVCHGEQLHIQFTSGERFGPIAVFLTNVNFIVFINPFLYLSYVLSAIIAAERCLCVYFPFRFKSLMSIKTIMGIIVMLCIAIFGLFFLVAYRYRLGCVYDPTSGAVVITGVEGKFYLEHKELINVIEGSIFGVGLPGFVMTVVTVTTIMTIVKLRQAVAWRSETSSSISPREVALTKMLVCNSILFITCTFPNALNRFTRTLFPEVNAGRHNQNFFLAAIWICQTFGLINVTFNIVVYYIMGSHYRKTFHGLFSRKSQPEKK